MAITTNGGAGITADAVATLSNKTLEAPTINNATFTGAQAGLAIKFNNTIVFEGTTDDAYEMTLSAGDPTADRTITFPDSTGTVALTSDITVTASSTNTFTNKSISLTTNTISGTTAEFNTALSDDNFATLTGSETLSNKTLTAPKFADLGFIADANGNELIILDTVTSAVNEVTLANAATGNTPTLTASGGDTNIGITLTPKGSGNITATNLVYTQTLNTPSFTTNAYTLALTDQGDILLASNGSTAGTINIPTNASVAFPTGTQITIAQTGSGQITIQATTSGTTTVNSVGATATAPKLRTQYSSATCIKTATDTWLVIGDIS